MWLIIFTLLFSLINCITRAHGIALNDHENYFYFAVELQPGDEGRHNTRSGLQRRALDVHSFLNSDSDEYIYLNRIGELDRFHLFAHPKATKNKYHDPEDLSARINTSNDIAWVNQQIPTKRLFKRNALLSETEKRKLEIFDPGFMYQFHLENNQELGNDINVTGVWKEGIFGKNVGVAFIDDGLDYEHPDLADNYYAKGSYDFNDHRPEPKPTLIDDFHGTRCAGEVAAKRNNVCGVGVAWEAKVAGIRILSGSLTEADEAAAINFDFHNNHIYSCSWGPADNGKAMDAPPKIVAEAFYNGIENGRSGLGSLFVFATGNGGTMFDNCNFDGYTNSIFTITIGAIDRANLHPKYSEECSAQLAVTYSSGQGSHIYTSDLHGKCTANHGGTSAAAPIASGMYALVMSIRPDFTWRDFQSITVLSAIPITLNDPDWVTVARGRKYNHSYGFGKLDAYALVQAAKNHTLLKPQAVYRTPLIEINKTIPENQEGFISSVEVKQNDLETANFSRLEQVTVTLWIDIARRGDISVNLKSPNGYISILATKRPYDDNANGFRNWTFMSVKHWDENPVGNWTIQVIDNDHPEITGTFRSWLITFWGESIVVIPTSSSTLTSTQQSTSITSSTISSTTSKSTNSVKEDANSIPISSNYFGIAVLGLIAVFAGAGFYQYRKGKVATTTDYEFQVLGEDQDNLLNSTFEDEDLNRGAHNSSFEDEFDISLVTSKPPNRGLFNTSI